MALDVRPDNRLLLRVLREPDRLSALLPLELSRVIDAAEQARLLGWLLSQVDALPTPAVHPAWLADRLANARAMADEYDRSVRWEIDRLRRAFTGTGIPWVLLKGAAYLAASLPPGRGRRVADIDVLVPQGSLGDAERALRAWGWDFGDLDAYDDRYYRQWMHELPPMVHSERRSVVDLHHAILPRTARLQPSSSRLLERSVEVTPGVRVLCPSHMVLHAAAHLFHDGQIAGAIRDLVDLDGLFRSLGTQGGFWDDFEREARELDLRRPAYYAVRFATQVLRTSVPDDVVRRLSDSAPSAPVRVVMDHLVINAVPGARGRVSLLSAFALYVRSHWLRMPPWLLARHLARKGLRSALGSRADV